MKILIVEDEPHAQKELVRIVKKVIPDAEIVDYIDSIEEGIEWFEENVHPDLVFMDIQLSDGLSFEILEKVSIESPIIFTTAFDQYAIRAFDHHSVDYLLKPIEEADLKKAIDKLNFFTERKKSSDSLPIDEIKHLLTGKSNNFKKRFLIKRGDTISYIKSEDIAFFKSSSENTYLITYEKKQYVIDFTLEELQKSLDPSMFFRATRKYILNINSIEKVSKYFNNRLMVSLSPQVDDKIIVSRAKVNAFLNWMEE